MPLPISRAAAPAYLFYLGWRARYRRVRSATALLEWGGAPLRLLASQLLPLMPEEPKGTFPEIRVVGAVGTNVGKQQQQRATPSGAKRATATAKQAADSAATTSRARMAGLSSLTQRLKFNHTEAHVQPGRPAAAPGGSMRTGVSVGPSLRGFGEQSGQTALALAQSQRLDVVNRITAHRSQQLMFAENSRVRDIVATGSPRADEESVAAVSAADAAAAREVMAATQSAVVDEHAAEQRRFAISLIESSLACSIFVDPASLVVDVPEVDAIRHTPAPGPNGGGGTPMRTASTLKKQAEAAAGSADGEAVVVPVEAGMDTPVSGLVLTEEEKKRRKSSAFEPAMSQPPPPSPSRAVALSSPENIQSHPAAAIPVKAALAAEAEAPTADADAAAVDAAAAAGGKGAAAAGSDHHHHDNHHSDTALTPAGRLLRLLSPSRKEKEVKPLKASILDKQLEKKLLGRCANHLWGPDEHVDEEDVWQSGISTYVVSGMVIVFFAWCVI